MKDKNKLYILLVIAIIMITLFLFQGLNESNFKYNLLKRIQRIVAIILTGGAIGFSSLIFQTITNNRILTPNILGLDALYGFLQTFAVFVFGTSSIVMNNNKVNFIFTTTLMLLSILILYRLVFENGKRNIFFILLVGTVLGTLFKSLSTFMQVLIDPNEFQALQGRLFASFSNINTEILLIAVISMLLSFAFIYDDLKKLDVMLLGRDTSINLGINYNSLSKKILLIVSVLVSISTALVGSITFLGLIVVNVSYQMFKSYKHNILILGSMLISVIALVGGQFLVERILNYNSTVSIIINFIGGSYFIYLLLKENKR